MSRPLVRLFLAGVAVALLGCSSGVMTVDETHYFAPVNEDNVNYYRLRISAETHLGVSQYRSGWFPTTSVDRLFGKVDDEGGVKSLEARSAMESLLTAKIQSTYSQWLDAAANPATLSSQLDGLMAAQRRILAYPAFGATEPYPGALEVDYNPMKGIAIRRADEKLVFVLSSNPDEVVGKIANFSESDQTTRTINRLGDLMALRVRGDLAGREAAQGVRAAADTMVFLRIKATVDAAKAATSDGSAGALDAVGQELQRLLAVLDGSTP
jgi:hypothetical protein